MPATYIRRSGINLTNAVLEMHGIKQTATADKTALLPRACYFCRHRNPPTHEYCEECQKPLDPTQIAAQERTANDMINTIVEAKINEILAKRGLVRV